MAPRGLLSHALFFLRRRNSIWLIFPSTVTPEPHGSSYKTPKMFGGRKTKAGSGGGLTVRARVSPQKGGRWFQSSCFSKLQGLGRPRRGRRGRVAPPRSLWRWPTRREAGRRPRGCQAETANEEIGLAQQTFSVWFGPKGWAGLCASWRGQGSVHRPFSRRCRRNQGIKCV